MGISKDLPTTYKKPRQGALAALNVAAGPVGGGESQVVSWGSQVILVRALKAPADK